MTSAWRSLLRLAALLLLAALALQLYFLARVALMIVLDPQSTTFQRSEIWRLLTEQHKAMHSSGRNGNHGALYFKSLTLPPPLM